MCGESHTQCLLFVDRSTSDVVDLHAQGWSFEDVAQAMDTLSVLCLNCRAKLWEMAVPQRAAIIAELETVLDAKDELEFDTPISQLPPQPTDAFPGTTEKIEVMRQRFSQRYPVMHPGDAERCLD